MSDMTVQLKRAKDDQAVALIAALADEIWHQHYAAILDRAQIDYMVAKFQSAPAIAAQIAQGYIYTLAYVDDAPAGYCALHPEPEEERMFLSKLYVKKACRGQGVARALLDDALAKSAGCRSIYLTVNKYNADSIAVYKHLGFAVMRQQKTDIGSDFYMDDYIMARSL